MYIRALNIVLVALLLAFPGSAARTAAAASLESQLFILTSFPEFLFGRYKQAFEEAHPGTKIFILHRKTSSAIDYVQEGAAERIDLFWASSPDAFEVLKRSNHLTPVTIPGNGIATSVGGLRLNDPEGYYTTFAISGYGIMWNTRYFAEQALPLPRDWDDLKNPAYFRHLGISAPSRSGTTHVIVESILQDKGWQEGWASLLEIAGNLATVTARSFGVPAGVKSRHFGAGAVIDFLGLAPKASGAPIEFAYAASSPLTSANIAMVRKAPHPKAARAFISFLLSPRGQRILLEPAISRLPIRPDVYASAPPEQPNPFKKGFTAKLKPFDTALSTKRYNVVNALFDKMITFRVKFLNRAWKAVHDAEARLGKHPNRKLRAQLAKARELLTQVPIDANESTDPRFTATLIRRKPGLPVAPRQVEIEDSWERFARLNQTEAARLAEQVLTLIEPVKN